MKASTLYRGMAVDTFDPRLATPSFCNCRARFASLVSAVEPTIASCAMRTTRGTTSQALMAWLYSSCCMSAVA